MKLTCALWSMAAAALLVGTPVQAAEPATDLDQILAQENSGRDVVVAEKIDDLEYLRRLSVDLIGRIPTEDEIREYMSWSPSERREKLVEKLLEHPRFVDRWTVFFADMLRIRSNAPGGPQFLAYVHQSLKKNVPYDEMCRELISANGKEGKTPEIGYILGDDADPMALAGATAQVFMGIRIACAQCHDHPFDVWTRQEFYDFAAFFGKTQRMVTPITETVYTTEVDQSRVLWPPEDEAEAGDRVPVKPKFPFELSTEDRPRRPVERLVALRQAERQEEQQASSKKKGPSVDDLLAEGGRKARERTEGIGAELIDVKSEVKKQTEQLKVFDDIYRPSEYRQRLGELVTNPYNRYFSRALVNRVWKELLGRGFVEPVDDFSEYNTPSHPETLNYLADEFIANGFELRDLVRIIVTSDAYQRSQLPAADEGTRQAAEQAFTAAPLRRMISEALYDSIVQAGHLFDTKYRPGTNQRTVEEMVRVAVPVEGEEGAEVETSELAQVVASAQTGGSMQGMQGMRGRSSGYDLEKAIELDFEAVLNTDEDAPTIDKMRAMSAEELEALEMQKKMEAQKKKGKVKYVTKWIERTIDENPQFASAMRMASPANPNHFLRIFGQPARSALGDHRTEDATMRQALMMLNGRLTHEASKVGNLERMHQLLVGEKADLDEAVRLAYREILTREPAEEELKEARQLVEGAESPLDGMADLRWILLNSHEFRFLP